MGRPGSPIKRGGGGRQQQQPQHDLQKAQTQLGLREVRNILNGCKNNFNAELKKQSNKRNSSTMSTLKNENVKPNQRRTLSMTTPSAAADLPALTNGHAVKESKSALPSPTDRSSRSKGSSPTNHKSNSAPPSPVKSVSNASSSSAKLSMKAEKRKFSEPVSIMNTPNKKGKMDSLLQSDAKKRKKVTQMNEVSKLHMDEGVGLLLHGLPISRRKTQTTLFSASANNGINHSANYGFNKRHSPTTTANSSHSNNGRISPKSSNSNSSFQMNGASPSSFKKPFTL